MGEKIKVLIAGINGRMGRASAKALLAEDGMELCGGFGKSGAPYVGKDLGTLVNTPETGILVSDGIEKALAACKPDVLLDFTRAEVAIPLAKAALENGIRPIIGTSGLQSNDVKSLSDLAKSKKLGAMIVPNFSLGAVLMMEFAKQAGEYFRNVEIVEMHQPKKVDAPSGTAMHTANKLSEVANDFNPPQVQEHELLTGARGGKVDSGVRVHSLRLPGLISHQEVIFGSAGELLTVRHDSFNTDCFIKGILMAIRGVMRSDELLVGLDTLLN
jgi:4-hydroxy-tetrahydrodipicolinate reductase